MGKEFHSRQSHGQVQKLRADSQEAWGASALGAGAGAGAGAKQDEKAVRKESIATYHR